MRWVPVDIHHSISFDLQEGGVLVEVYNNQSMFRYEGWSIHVYAF